MDWPLDPPALRAALDGRFDDRLRAARAYLASRAWPPSWPAPRLPALVRETLVFGSRLDGGATLDALAGCYCDALVVDWVRQLLTDEPGCALLWRSLEVARVPRLARALDGIARHLDDVGLSAEGHLGGASAGEVLARRPCAAALYAGTVFGVGTPMLAAGDAARRALARAVDEGVDPDTVVDQRLSAGLVHELAHGVHRPFEGPPCPWMVTEAATILLHLRAAPRQVIPEVPGEAVPGTALYALFGAVLARLFGERALMACLRGELALEEAVGDRTGRALRVLGWQALAPRLGAPPLYPDGLAALTWSRVAAALHGHRAPHPALDAAAAVPVDRPEGALGVPSLAALAAAHPWEGTAWWHEPAAPLDVDLLRWGLRALFVGYRLRDGVVEAVPVELPGGRVRLLARECRLEAVAPAPEQAGFGAPAWLLPPPFARRLVERGEAARELSGVARADVGALADDLIAELSP